MGPRSNAPLDIRILAPRHISGYRVVGMSYGKRSIAILGAGFLVLGVALMWFLSNFFYDLFWAFLDGYHVRQADVIAYTMAHLIPFVLSAIIIAGIWFALRWELSREHQSVRAVARCS